MSTAKGKQLKYYDSATLSEMKHFFSLYMAMGIVTQKDINDHWQINYPIIQTPTFHQVMSRNRWKSIWSHLHFANNATAIPRGEPGHDRLFKIRNVIQLVVSKFPKYYQASRLHLHLHLQSILLLHLLQMTQLSAAPSY